MCGFLAEYGFNNSGLSEPSVFANLLALSKHRGPDSTEVSRQDNFQLGFNRLSILDLSENGNQPKTSPSKRFHVVFNGEIYNYKTLAKTYELKNLMSTSDSEVLVHLLDKIGVEAAVMALNGMFAIAIVDTKLNSLYLTRDFAGIKPLFYGLHTGGMVAASQFDQVFKHPRFVKTLSLRPEIVKEYFGFGYMQAPNTIYKNIFQVNPGELVVVNASGEIEKKDIIKFSKQFLESSETPDFKSVINQAVNRQLVSDVSVATFLSGGIDSPLIAAYAKSNKPDIEAFTLKVNHPELNESTIATAYAKHLKIKQEVVAVSEADMQSRIEAHFKAFPEPFGDFSSIPTYVITEKAKQRHTVMLSGDGGDELFFGYPRMRDALKKRKWFKYPLAIRKNLVRITNKLGLTNTYAPYYKSFNEFMMHKHVQLSAAALDKMFPHVNFSKEMRAMYTFDNTTRTQLLHQLRWSEFYAHMQRVLVKVDRSSMKHSLEVRVPFLDKTVIQESWKVSANLKSKMDLKKTLKQLLSKEIPEDIINQKKMGFSVPIGDWLKSFLKEDVLFQIMERPFYGESVVNTDAVKKFIQDFYDNKHQDAWGVWHVYAWQKWAEKHIFEES